MGGRGGLLSVSTHSRKISLMSTHKISWMYKLLLVHSTLWNDMLLRRRLLWLRWQKLSMRSSISHVSRTRIMTLGLRMSALISSLWPQPAFNSFRHALMHAYSECLCIDHWETFLCHITVAQFASAARKAHWISLGAYRELSRRPLFWHKTASRMHCLRDLSLKHC